MNSPRRSSRPPSAALKPSPRADRSSNRSMPHGLARRSACCAPRTRATSPIPWQSASQRQDTALPLAPTLLGYGMAFVGNLVSASIRLSVIGQTDGQRVMAALLPHLQEAATRAADSTLDDIGSATLRRRSRLAASRNPVYEALSLMTRRHTTWPPSRRHRRPGRLRQDDADGRALPALSRALRHLRHHQRHLHQGGRRDPDADAGAAARAHHGRRDRRLSAHRDPRGLLDQSRGHRRRCGASSRSST